MISPFTKPGTKVVCVDAAFTGQYDVPGASYAPTDDQLAEGEVYTVLAIVLNPHDPSRFGVVLDEMIREPDLPHVHSWQGYALQRFRPLDLPECLTSLLHTQPHDLDARVLETESAGADTGARSISGATHSDGGAL